MRDVELNFSIHIKIFRSLFFRFWLLFFSTLQTLSKFVKRGGLLTLIFFWIYSKFKLVILCCHLVGTNYLIRGMFINTISHHPGPLEMHYTGSKKRVKVVVLLRTEQIFINTIVYHLILISNQITPSVKNFKIKTKLLKFLFLKVKRRTKIQQQYAHSIYLIVMTNRTMVSTFFITLIGTNFQIWK